MTSDAVPDKVRDAVAGRQVTLLHTDLSPDEEARLREYFEED